MSRVWVSGKVLKLALESELEEGQRVTVDYDYRRNTPLQRAGGGDPAPGFRGQSVELNLAEPPPGQAENFAINATPGSVDLLATWDEVEGATSYRLRWRKSGGEFGADDAATATDAIHVITVSGSGRWEVRLRGCNESGCGSEGVRSVDVVRAASLRLERSRPQNIAATWDEVEGATSYTLSWRRIGEDPQTEGQTAAARQLRAASGDGGQGISSQESNRLNLPAGRTNANFTVPDDGAYQAELRAMDDGNELIALANAHLNQAPGQPDTVPPRMVRGQIDGDQVILYFSEPLDENTVGGRFHPYVQNDGYLNGGLRKAPMEVSGNKVMVDLRGQVLAVEGQRASIVYWVYPEDTSLRDLAGNKVWTPRVSYDGSRSTKCISLRNLTGRPKILPVTPRGALSPSGVAISSDAGEDGFYRAGDRIKVKLIFSEAVDVTGTPQVRIDLDPADGGERWADYDSGSGTRKLEFAYTVVEGDYAGQGVAAAYRYPGLERWERSAPLRRSLRSTPDSDMADWTTTHGTGYSLPQAPNPSCPARA